MEWYVRIRTLRKEKKETQQHIADAIGITSRQYQRYEAGEQKPSFDYLIALADHFQVTLDYLTGRTDER